MFCVTLAKNIQIKRQRLEHVFFLFVKSVGVKLVVFCNGHRFLKACYFAVTFLLAFASSSYMRLFSFVKDSMNRW